MSVSPRNLVILAFAVLALAGCGVDNLDGVTLATAAIRPTNTPPPTTTPDPLAAALPNTTTKEFLDTTITLSYPEGWQTDESGQYMIIADPNSATADLGGSGLSIFVSLTRRLNLETDTENLAALAMQAFVREFVDRGFGNPDSVPNLDQTHAFAWGTHDAAIFAWQADDGSLDGIQLVVLDSDRRRFVLFSAQSPAEFWPEFYPTIRAMLATVSLDDDVLPAADLLAAFEAISAS